jgi:hypothetical protein
MLSLTVVKKGSNVPFVPFIDGTFAPRMSANGTKVPIEQFINGTFVPFAE